MNNLIFSKGSTDPSGDCGNFSAGINAEGPNQFAAHSKTCTWFKRIECYGETPASADELRDKVLALLLTTEHDGELHKAVFMALESYGGADTFRDGVLALVAQNNELRAAPTSPQYSDINDEPGEAISLHYDAVDACAEIERGGAPGDVIRDLNDEMVSIRTALEHIQKTAGQSRTQTRRLRWISKRAELALAGRPYVASEHDLPVDGDKERIRLRRKNAELRMMLGNAQGDPS